MHQRSVTLGLFVSAIVGGIVGKITTPGSFAIDPEVINNKSRTILALVSELTGENGTSTEIANNTRTHQLLFELQKEASDLISVPYLDPDLVTWLDVLLQALEEIFNALDRYIEENLRTSLGNLARHLKGAKIYLGDDMVKISAQVNSK